MTKKYGGTPDKSSKASFFVEMREKALEHLAMSGAKAIIEAMCVVVDVFHHRAVENWWFPSPPSRGRSQRCDAIVENFL